MPNKINFKNQPPKPTPSATGDITAIPKKAVIIVLCVISVILALCTGTLLLLRSCAPVIVEWLFRPVRSVTLSQEDALHIEENLGIALPEEAEFIEKITLPGRDSTYIYIIELDLSDRKPAETADAFLRRMLSLDEARYFRTYETDPSDTLTWGSTLSDLGYAFSCRIEYKERDFSYIYYIEKDDRTIQAALIYSQF